MNKAHIFYTKRLQIRQLFTSDLAGFHDLQGNPKVAVFTNGHAQNLAEATEDLTFVMSKYNQKDNDFWVWAIEEQKSNLFIGTCAIVKNEKAEWEIGYKIRECFWGKGFGYEAAQSLLHHCHKQMGLQNVLGYADKANIASIKILGKLGMQFVEGIWNEEMQTQDLKFISRLTQ